MTTLVPKFKQTATGAVNRAFNLKLAEFVSVMDFGAVGNGTSDDTAAIQAAINYCQTNVNPVLGVNSPAAGSQTLFFPTGEYKITSALIITQSIDLLGDGHSEFSNGARLFQATANTDTITVQPVALGNSISVRNMVFISNSGTAGSQLNFTKASGSTNSIRILGNTFGTPSNLAIKIQTADDVMIYDNLFDVSAGLCIALGTSAAADAVSNCCIRGNTFYSIPVSCILLYNVVGLIIAENRIYPSTSTATFIDGTNTIPYQIKNVTVIGNKLSGVYCFVNITAASVFNIIGNTGLTMGSGTGATLNCITVVGTNTNINVTGNVLSGAYDTKNFYNDAGATVTGANISGNTFTNTGGTGQALRCTTTTGTIDTNSFIGFTTHSVSEKTATTGSSISPGVIAPNTTYTATVTLTGASQGDTVTISTSSTVWIVPSTGVFVVAFVSAANTISIQYTNPTAINIGVPAHDVLYKVTRG